MKKQLLPGVLLGFSLLLSGAVYANSIKDTSDTATLQKTEQPSAPASLEKTTQSQPNELSLDRFASASSHHMGARWSSVDQKTNTEIMAFTSTFTANNAAKLMGGNDSALSFANFGRVPFYQVLGATGEVTANVTSQATSRQVASVPEPMTLTLLGTGLAVMATKLRKRNKTSHK